MDNATRIWLYFPTGEVYSVAIKEVNTQEDNSMIILKNEPGFELSSRKEAGEFNLYPNSYFGVRYRIPRSKGYYR